MTLYEDESAQLRRYALAVPMLEADEAFTLAKRWREQGNIDAASKIAASHLKLVVRVARGFRGYKIPLADLISEGCIGIMEALKRFDPDKGFQFATYAKWWIRFAIQQCILLSPMVRTGTSSKQKELFFNFSRAMRRAGVLDGSTIRQDQIEAVARYCGVGPQDVITTLRCRAETTSLNTPLGEEDGDAQQDYLEDKATPDPEEAYVQKNEYDVRHAALQESLRVLRGREPYIFRARYLTEKEKRPTLELLGKKFGTSKERVRQIETRAFNKVQRAMLAHAEASPG